MIFFKWWYSEAYQRVLKYAKASYIFFFDLFSVKICLKTLFAPWKRDELSYEGLSLQQKFQIWTLNLSSRFIGFVIKIFTLLSYAVFTVFLSLLILLVILIWLLYPVIIIYFVLRALTLL